MALERTQLNRIGVASPCSASWNAMKGDDQVRFCGQCDKHVYNLSTMSLTQISDLLEKKEGRTCVRFYRRADGTVITDDCPVGVAAVRRRMMMIGAAAAAALSTLGFALFNSRTVARGLRSSPLGKIQVVRNLADWIERDTAPAIMGKMAMPPCKPARRDRATMGEVYIPPQKQVPAPRPR